MEGGIEKGKKEPDADFREGGVGGDICKRSLISDGEMRKPRKMIGNVSEAE